MKESCCIIHLDDAWGGILPVMLHQRRMPTAVDELTLMTACMVGLTRRESRQGTNREAGKRLVSDGKLRKFFDVLRAGDAALCPIIAALILLTAAQAARAQDFQQSFSSALPGQPTSTAVVPFAPVNPAASVNLADPAVAGFFNPANNGAGTVLSSGRNIVALSSAAGSQAVSVTIPSLGITQVFSGGNRAANYAQALYLDLGISYGHRNSLILCGHKAPESLEFCTL